MTLCNIRNFALFHYDLPKAKFQQAVITGSEYISTPVCRPANEKRRLIFSVKERIIFKHLAISFQSMISM